MKLSDWRKVELLKAIEALYELSCQVDSKDEVRRLEKLAENIEQVVEEYGEGAE